MVSTSAINRKLDFSHAPYIGLGERVAAARMPCGSRQQKTFGRSDTRGSSFLKPAWSEIGFSMTLQLSSSHTVSTVHLNWEINMPVLSAFIIAEVIP